MLSGGHILRSRSKARITALVLVNLFLVGRVVVLWANRDANVQVAPLPAERIIVTQDASTSTCHEAVLAAIDPDAGEVRADTMVGYDVARIQAISDAILENQLRPEDPAAVIKTAPVLATLPIYEGEHHIYGTLWLPPAPNGTYDNSAGAVVYVDAETALPLFIFTGISVDDPLTGEGCLVTPPVDWVGRYRAVVPYALAAVVVLLGMGLLLDYRERVNNFKLHKPG